MKFKELSDDVVEFASIVISATNDTINEFSDEKRMELADKLNELKQRKAELYNIKKKKHIKMFHHLAKQSPFLFKGVKKQNENIDKLLNNLINLVEGKK